jgi:hypothetical protein
MPTRRNGPCPHGHGAIALTLIEVIVPDHRQRRPSHDARPVEVPIQADVLGEGMKFVLGIGCETEPRWFVGPVAALTRWGRAPQPVDVDGHLVVTPAGHAHRKQRRKKGERSVATRPQDEATPLRRRSHLCRREITLAAADGAWCRYRRSCRTAGIGQAHAYTWHGIFDPNSAATMIVVLTALFRYRANRMPNAARPGSERRTNFVATLNCSAVGCVSHGDGPVPILAGTAKTSGRKTCADRSTHCW